MLILYSYTGFKFFFDFLNCFHRGPFKGSGISAALVSLLIYCQPQTDVAAHFAPFSSVIFFLLDHREAKYFPQEECNFSWKDSLSPDGLLIKTLSFKRVQFYSCYQTWWGSWHILLLSLMTSYLTCLWGSSMLILCTFWVLCFKKVVSELTQQQLQKFYLNFICTLWEEWNCFPMFLLLPWSAWQIHDSGWSGVTSRGSLKP